MDRKVSVVVSVYNEEKALEEFYRETTKVLGQISWDYELIFVNDGSRDGRKRKFGITASFSECIL